MRVDILLDGTWSFNERDVEIMPEASPVEATRNPRIRFNTTPTALYDLVETIVNEVDGENQKLVPQIVVHLVNTGKIKLVKKV